jgi:hypothetical protein
MSANRTAFALLSLILAGEAALSWYAWRELQGLRELSMHFDDLRGKIADEEHRAAALRAKIARIENAASEKAQAVEGARSKRQQGSDAKANAAAQKQRRLDAIHLAAQAWINSLDNKQFFQMLSEVDRNYNERTAAPFLRSLGLSADQVNHMLDLIGQMQIAKMDANQTANLDDLDPQSRLALVMQIQQDVANQIESYLGDNLFSDFEQWNRESGVREIATGLQNSLSYTSSPLSGQQVQALTNAMYQSIPADRQPDATGIGALVPLAINNNFMPRVTQGDLNAAQSVLTPAQMTALQEIANRQQAYNTIRKTGGF